MGNSSGIETNLESSASKNPGKGPLSQRQLALKMIEDGRHEEAKAIYEGLLSANFEVHGTYCHLARIDLLTDNFKEIAAHADEAWRHRTEAPT